MPFDIASGAEIRLSYVAEATFGVTPGSPSMKTLRALSGENLKIKPGTFVSEEYDPTGQVKSERHVSRDGSGDIPMYLTYQDVDDWLQAIMRGTWSSTSPMSAATISASAVDNSLNDSADGFGDYLEGDWITAAGFSTAGNNGLAMVLSATSSKLVLDKTLITEGAGNTITITRHPRLDMGVVNRSFTVQREYTSKGTCRQFTGVVPVKLVANFNPGGGVKLTISNLFKDMTTDASLGTPAAATDNEPFSGIDFSSIQEAGVDIAKVSSIELTLDWGGKAPAFLGSKVAQDVVLGRGNVTGKAVVAYVDETLTTKLLDEVETSFRWALTDLGGNRYIWCCPRAKFNDENMDGGPEDGLMQSLAFRGLKDPDLGTSLYIVRVPAA